MIHSMINNQGDATACGSSLRTVIRISPSCDCPVHFSVFKISLLVITRPFAKYLCLPDSDIVFLPVARNSSANLGFWLNFAVIVLCSLLLLFCAMQLPSTLVLPPPRNTLLTRSLITQHY